VDAKDERRARAVAEMMEKFGGREAFFGRLDKRYAEFTRVWKQDAERMGRILRAHLAVEHFVRVILFQQLLTKFVIMDMPWTIIQLKI